jgi:hypothetical protein
MASAVRVIGGNADGSVDPLGDGKFGRTVLPEDRDQLVTAICGALDDPKPDHDFATRFKSHKFVEHIQKLLELLLPNERIHPEARS